MIQPTRIQPLNDVAPRPTSDYVLYWMQQSQRVAYNHALEHAISVAKELDRPLVVCFGLMDDYPAANARHYAFMLEGLRDVERELRARRIMFVVKRGQPSDVALHFAKRACAVVCDRGYLRHQKQWRETVAHRSACAVVQVESDAIVPVEVASDHQEFAARTIRPKIHRAVAEYLVPLRAERVKRSSLELSVRGDIDVRDPVAALVKLKVDRSVAPSSRLTGGSRAATKLLDVLVRSRLSNYDESRREPADDGTSHLSPYLHFGQISSLEVALAAKDAKKVNPSARDAFLEELIVRRELAINFVQYCTVYDTYDGAVPRWAKETLRTHARDARPTLYTLDQLERARTHDRWWNAAQREMVDTGFMHNSMRMYWGKKILEWTKSPKRAFEIALYLNDKYFIDGRDPNGYANVAWLFGLHDRPWGPARKIFGTVRYMNAAGLERKFDMETYARRWLD